MVLIYLFWNSPSSTSYQYDHPECSQHEDYQSVKSEIEIPVYKEQNEKENKDNEKEIPKIIWTYWDNDSIPELVKKCMTSWKKYNPTYTIHLLSNSNLSQFLDTDVLSFKLANYPQRISDFIRIHVLAKHGGIWADASLLMTAPLDWIHDGSDVVCYHIDQIRSDKVYPVLENWFIAAKPNDDFIKKWRDEFVNINQFEGGEDYLENVKKRGTNLDTVFCTPYLSMHTAAQFVLQKIGTTSKMNVMDAREGPYRHLRFNTNPLSFEQGLDNLCHDAPPPIIKFRGIDRHFMNENPEKTECVISFIQKIIS